jgi:hypothetical protein
VRAHWPRASAGRDISPKPEASALYDWRMLLTKADIAYITANYRPLEELCDSRAESPDDICALIDERKLPRPSYVLPDGTGMFPADYFRLVDEAGGVDGLREHFTARHHEATLAQHEDPVERDWQMYLDGTWGVCLRDVIPETIVRKNALVWALCELLTLPRPGEADWRQALREQVDELDELEREFTPDYDRSEQLDRPPTRDLIIAAARERYPELFAAVEA